MLPEPRRKFVADLGLKHVPVLEEFAVFERFQTADELLEWVAQDPKREGVVFKSTEYILGQIVSFKVVSNRYLLK